MRINSYGEVYDAKVVRSCGIEDWDNQVLEIIRKMPRWTPAINYYGKGEYQKSVWTIPVVFKRNGSLIAVGRYYHLPKGKYRICKSFSAKRENIELSAEFEIK